MKNTLLAGIFACCAFAQAPDLIRVVREGVVLPEVYGRAGVNVIGMSAISGAGESWLIELHGSFASIEDLDQTLRTAGLSGIPGADKSASGDDVLPSSRAWIARHRPGLSYRPDQAMQNLAKARYMDVVVYRIAPGDRAEFAKVQQLREYSRDIVNADRPDMAYEVISGAPAGTYVSLIPLSSLRSLDDSRPATPVYAEGAVAAARGASRSMDVQRERLSFRVEPRLSFVSGEFASADSVFWHPANK